MSELLIKLLGLCLVACCLAVIFKKEKSEYSLFISVAVSIIVLLYILKAITAPIQILKEKIDGLGIDANYFKVALKAVGISYLTSFIADTCRDCGQTALASKAELAGKTAIFLLSVPLTVSVLETALGFIQ